MKNERPLCSPWAHVVRLSLGVAAVVTLLVVAFAWPALNSAPRDLPLAVAGPPAAVQQVDRALETARPGAFDVVPATDEASARALITDREVYGALVLAPSGPPTLLTAPAASPAVAQLLTQVAASLPSGPEAAAPTGPRVETVAPLPPGDPRGVGLTVGALPLSLGGIVVGVGSSVTLRGGSRRLVAVLLGSAAVGAAAVGVLHGWLEVLAGSVLAEMGVVALGVAAVGMTITGLRSLIGLAGIPVGAALVLFLGNPLSAATSAPELLPRGWSALGQALPPGAMTAALRSVSGFGGTGALPPVLVLAAWCALGLLLLGVGTAVTRRELGEGVVSAPITVPLTDREADVSIAAVRHGEHHGERVGASD